MNIKRKKTVFLGAASALATPFTDSGGIDYGAFGRLMDHSVLGGVSALVIAGTTGESATLDDSEKLSLLSYASERYGGGRTPLIMGVGTNSTAHSVALSREACRLGADALLVVAPYYNKPTEEGMLRHFTEIADASEAPVILYNIPSRTGVNIPFSVYERLAEHENIIGIKDASGNIASAAHLIASLGDFYDVYSGNDDMLLPYLSLGGRGVISVVSNVLPSEVCGICEMYSSGDIRGARESFSRILPLTGLMFAETNPIPLKAALSEMGLCKNTLRLPLCPSSDSVRDKIREELVRLGVIEK